MEKTYTVVTRNNKTERVSMKGFIVKEDAINYVKLQMKRKIGKDYKNIVKPFKGAIFAGFADPEFNFEFCIWEKQKDGSKIFFRPIIFKI